MKEYTITNQIYAPPNNFFFFVKVKVKWWKFTWWKTVASFYNLEDAEKFYKKLTNE